MKQYIFTFIILFISFNAVGQNIIPNGDLTFVINDKTRNVALYDKYSNDSLAKTIKTIHFVGFDTIPHKYTIFKNVNTAILESSDISGLDIFPLLESL